jgi:hypothetical protein
MRRTSAQVRSGSLSSRFSEEDVDAIFIIATMNLGDEAGYPLTGFCRPLNKFCVAAVFARAAIITRSAARRKITSPFAANQNSIHATVTSLLK